MKSGFWIVRGINFTLVLMTPYNEVEKIRQELFWQVPSCSVLMTAKLVKIIGKKANETWKNQAEEVHLG